MNPLIGGRDVGGGCGGRGPNKGPGRIKLVVNMYEDVAYKVDDLPKRGSEGSWVIELETDTPDEVVRTNFGDNLVTGV